MRIWEMAEGSVDTLTSCPSKPNDHQPGELELCLKLCYPFTPNRWLLVTKVRVSRYAEQSARGETHHRASDSSGGE